VRRLNYGKPVLAFINKTQEALIFFQAVTRISKGDEADQLNDTIGTDIENILTLIDGVKLKLEAIIEI